MYPAPRKQHDWLAPSSTFPASIVETVLATGTSTGNNFRAILPHPPAGLDVIHIERHIRCEGVLTSLTSRRCAIIAHAPCIGRRDGSIYKRPDGVVVIDPLKSRPTRPG